MNPALQTVQGNVKLKCGRISIPTLTFFVPPLFSPILEPSMALTRCENIYSEILSYLGLRRPNRGGVILFDRGLITG